MNPIYRFSINGHYVNPSYKDDMAKEFSQEKDQVFYRVKLNSKLNFINEDFDFINDSDFETEFILLMEISHDGGATWSSYLNGKFMKTDCEIDLDNKKIIVQPDALDDYTKVLAGIEKEYNIIKLAPEIYPVKIYKRPVIQIYISGDAVVGCFLSGMYWEQTCKTGESLEDMINKYHFMIFESYQEATITGSNIAEVNGVYTGTLNITYDQYNIRLDKIGNLYKKDNNNYRLDVSVTYHLNPKLAFYGTISYTCRMFYNNTVYWSSTRTYLPVGSENNFTIYPSAVNPDQNDITVTSVFTDIYGRYLLDVDTILGVATNDLPEDDFVDYNENYHKCIGYDFDTVLESNATQIDPTEYGRAYDGNYWKQLKLAPSTGIGTVFPIARSQWSRNSFWFYFHSLDNIIEVDGRKEHTIKDCYTISSMIKVLLKEFAPEITHEATPEYSQFLYGNYNPISYDSFTLLATQKTNLINGEYDEPAQKAPIKLWDITNMLKNCFRCFWYIEDGKFKIEHINYFRNGGSYSSEQIGDDLTTLENSQVDKPLSYQTNKFTFNKEDLPDRYEFKWMDDKVTVEFQGNPIDIVSKYVKEGKKEEINVANFTSDIDYMLISPSEINKDGFVLFAAIGNSNNYEVPINNVANDPDKSLQNGFLSFLDLQSKYHIYDLAARHVKINGDAVTAYGITKSKSQKIKYPSLTDPNLIKLIKTNAGNGQVSNAQINLGSRMCTITLQYEPN